MALSSREKERIIEYLDELDEAAIEIILASIKAFAEWLAKTLYSIYLKVKNTLGQIWNWLKSQF